MSSDVLSDVLAAVRLSGAVYFDFEVTAPWVAEAPPSREIAHLVLPRAQRVIEAHLIAEGTCWGGLVGGESIRLEEGDVFAFPQGSAHVLSSAPGMRATPEMAMYARPSNRLPLCIERGGGGERSRIVCSFLGCDDRPFNPLLASLPEVLHLKGAGRPASETWIGTLLSVAAREGNSARPGSENVLARLSELMFVESIRRYLETLPPSETGWLAGLRDPLVGRALAALHSAAGKTWSVESLAREVGASRSVLAERFADFVGHPPMHYLALWRMQLASRRLAEGQGVAEVAADVGYESEAAFSRAFKKLVGKSPGEWRRAKAPALPGDSR
ncbi:MAG: AraC family transcriptional regulator [Thermoanaerobaculia bacterium]